MANLGNFEGADTTRNCAMPALVAVHRNVIKDFTFSNGLFLPKGVKVAIPTHAVQTDEVC